MRGRLMFTALIGALLAMTSCAGPNPLTDSWGSGGPAGFWSGLWHGLICPIAFVISLFNHGVSIYEVHNSGGWYNTGFVFGLAVLGSAGRSAASDLSEVDDDDLLEAVRERGLLGNRFASEDDDDLDADDLDDEDEVETEDDELENKEKGQADKKG